jgi:ribonuclease VapC
MIVDASAIVAILLREPAYERIAATIDAASAKRMSAVSAVETACVMMSRLPRRSRDEIATKTFASIARLGITIEPVDERTAVAAARVYAEHGRGAGGAGLNFGDAFVAALASLAREPIRAAGTHEFRRAGIDQVD